jgi:hypothetical protein
LQPQAGVVVAKLLDGAATLPLINPNVDMPTSSSTSDRSRPQRRVARSTQRQDAPRAASRERGGRAPRSRRRAPSAHATRALDDFARLYSYFGGGALLAGALGWDQATVAEWRTRQVVRPQVKKVAQIELLLELCEETRPYLHEDHQVGEWISIGLPNLRGMTPAQWLTARGHRGLRELTYGLIDWMPRLPAGELESIEGEATPEGLASPADTPEAAEFLRMLSEPS